MGFRDNTDPLIQVIRLNLLTVKKKTCQLVSFALPADYTMKLKENKKQDKYTELKKTQWNMKMTVIPMTVRDLRTIPKDLEEWLKEL